MSFFLRLPDVVIDSVILHWSNLLDVLPQIDASFCNIIQRKTFLSFLCSDNFVLSVTMSTRKQLEWIGMRNVKIKNIVIDNDSSPLTLELVTKLVRSEVHSIRISILDEIHRHGISVDYLIDLINSCPKLKTLGLRLVDTFTQNVRSKINTEIFLQLSEIKCVCFTPNDCQFILFEHPNAVSNNLTTLDLVFMHGNFDCDRVIPFLKDCNHLEILSICGVGECIVDVSYRLLESIVKHCPVLNYLSFGNSIPEFDLLDVKQFIQNSVSLATFLHYPCRRYNTMRFIYSVEDGLIELTIGDFKESVDHIDELLHAIPNIHSLTLWRMLNVSTECISTIIDECFELKALVLHDCRNVTLSEIERFFREISSLCEFTLSCAYYSELDIRTIFTTAPNKLAKICISDAMYVSEFTIKKIIQANKDSLKLLIVNQQTFMDPDQHLHKMKQYIKENNMDIEYRTEV